MDPSISGRAIIISNGRCGSTLLSDLIAEQPDTLSAQEFFMSVASFTKGDALLTGEQYWELLSSPKPEVATLFRIGVPPKEVRYPRTGRWGDNMLELPRVLAITLAKLTPDPDALFDKLAGVVPGFPLQEPSAHHRMFLDLLTKLTDRHRWVERSGGSSYIAPYLLRSFPEARFVYLTRNREDTALSMSKHSSFQLIQLRLEAVGRFRIDPFRLEPGQEVPPEIQDLMPDRLTAETLRERGRRMERSLALCAFFTSQAEQALADSPPEHLLTMHYEELVAEPVAELRKLGEFLQFEDAADWAERMAGRVIAPSRKPAPAAV